MSRRKEYVVVPHQPGRWVWRLLVLLGLTIASGGVGYFVGVEKNHDHQRQLLQSSQTLSSQVAQLQSSNAHLNQRLIDLEKNHSIDQQALAQARDTIGQQDNRISQLKGDVAFYKNIMAPSSTETGLQVQKASIRAVPGDRRYAYQVVLTQVGDNHRYIHGVAAINLVGVHKGKRKILPLRDVDPSLKQLGLEFRFRYFQDFEGQLVLPEGFVPDQLQVIAKPHGSHSDQVEKAFRWQSIIRR